MCLPSDALSYLPSHLGFSYLGHGISLHGCSSKAQLLLLTLDEGYLLTTALPDLQRGIASLGPPALAQPQLLGHAVGGEEITLVQGKEQRLRFAGAAMKRYPTSKVRETQVRR